jgi:MoaA/NifB/PqqE/SkfB family radical SAM enzyme
MSVLIPSASVNLTRRCNLTCGYCNVIRTQFPRELSAEEWMRAFAVMDRIGIQSVTLSGGEPTVVPELPDLLRFLRKRTRLRCLLVSNSTFEDRLARVYAEAGLDGYVTSIDTLGGHAVDESSRIKSEAAWGKLELFRALGVPLLAVNMLVHHGNLAEIPEIVERLTGMGVAVHPVILHWGAPPPGQPANYWQNRSPDSLMKLLPCDQSRIEEVSRRLVQMKRDGYLLYASEPFLADMAHHAVGLDWHCHPYPRKLRVDADGAISCCQDIRGAVADRYRIFDLEDPERLAAFLEDWSRDSRPCPGCFYTDIYEAHQG